MSAESHSQPAVDAATTAQDASTPAARDAGTARAAAGGGLLLAGVALAAANMRPAVTSLASVLGEARESVGASSTWASVVTSVPTLCFGFAAFAAPVLARRWGANRVVGGALALLTAALVVRVLGGPWVLLSGTVLACAAIAMSNVLIPVVVRESFPHRIGLATGLYTTAMAAGGASGSAVTPWLDGLAGDWRLALATWTVLALAALCVWVPGSRKAGAPAGGEQRPRERRSLLRSPLAWVITAYFALQSTIAYVVMGWMPEVFKGAGMDATSAGALLGVLLLIGVPINMVLPPVVTRTRGQSGWALLLGVLTFAGLAGLLVAPLSAPLLWALLIGVGMSAFPLALVMISLRAGDAAGTRELSAMAQSIGYLIASAGPFLFGVLHDGTGSWSASLVAAMVIVAVQAVVGIFAGRPRTV